MADLILAPTPRTPVKNLLRRAAKLPLQASAAVASATVKLNAMGWEPGAEVSGPERAIQLLPRGGLKVGAMLGEALALPGRAILGLGHTYAEDGGMRTVATGGAIGGLKSGLHGLLIDLPRALGIAVGGIAGAALLGTVVLLGATAATAGILATAIGLGIDALARHTRAFAERASAHPGLPAQAAAERAQAALGEAPAPELLRTESSPLPEREVAPHLARSASLPADLAAVQTPEWHAAWTGEAHTAVPRTWTQFDGTKADAGSPKGPKGWSDPGEI